MSNLRFDIYPAATPTGVRLTSLDSEEYMEGTGARVELNGTGSGRLVIHGDNAKVTTTNFARGNYVLVTDLDLVSTKTVATSAAADNKVDTTAAHGFAVNDRVEFTAITGGTGLAANTPYWVQAVSSATEVKLATSRGGAEINFTTDITAGTIRRLEDVAGFFLSEGDFVAVSKNEQGGRILTFGGPGSLAYLGRAEWAHEPYVASGSGVYNGPRDDGRWHWFQDQYGDILKRAIDEAQDADRPTDPIPAVTYTFTNTDDTASDPWDSFTDGDYTIPMHENYLDSVAAWMRFGLTIIMTPDLELLAFQNEYGTDRSSGTYAANKVRFEAAINIASGEAGDLTRGLSDSPRVSLLRVQGDSPLPADVIEVTDGGAPYDREGSLMFPGTTDDDILTAAGEEDIANRQAETDRAILTHIPGLNSTTGLYTPTWSGADGTYWLGDTVTLHTGTGSYDFNELELRVAAISWVLREAGDWDILVELGATYYSISQPNIPGVTAPGTSQTCNCPHPPSGPYGEIAPTTVYHWGFEGTLLDDTATYSWGNHAHATYTHTHVINPGMGNRSGTHPPMAPGVYHVTVTLNRGVDGFNPGGIRLNVYADDGALETFVGQSALVTSQSPVTETFDVTMPAGTDTFSCEIPYNFSECHDILITTGSASDYFGGDTPPPAATDSVGSIGTTTDCYALCDHRHAAQTAANTPTESGQSVQEALEQIPVDLIHGQRNSYLASCFKATDESLYLLISDDGKTWTEWVGDVYNPADGDFVRDPSLLVFEGTWWIVHTRGPAAGSAVANFGVASSPDGVSWTEEDDVDMSSIAGIDRTWAPQWFVDADGDPHVFAAVTTDSAVTFTIYEVHPTSAGFATWSTPVDIGLGPNYIDPYVILKGGYYYLWVKNETTKLIEVFRSTSLTSGYTAWKTGDWAGWGSALEGESLVQVDANTWRIYLDSYNTDEIYYSDSSDDWATWTAKTAVTAPYYMQHPEVLHAGTASILGDIITALGFHWEPVVFDNAGTPEIVFFQDASSVWDIVMHEVADS